MEIFIILGAFLVVAIAAQLFGADSRPVEKPRSR